MEAEAVTFSAAEAMFWINNTWMLVAAFMVFIMHLGFAALEAGLTQAKNTVNILFKNLCILSIGMLTYALIGFNLMYPGEAWVGWIVGWGGVGLASGADGLTVAYADGHYTYWTDFIFQAMFAATAATIVSGAVAERVKLSSFLMFATVYVAVIYPIVGFWQWGGGWLAELGFHDFAGSTIVHSVGGWAALAGAIVLGPRLGRYTHHPAQKPHGHSLPLAAIGVLLLWFGWYGFNGGSVLSADPAAVSLVVVTTSLAAATGALTTAVATWTMYRKPCLAMALNGALAGLVGITAGADAVSPMAAIVIGVVAGGLVLGATRLMNRIRIDDPVGAVPVHLVCGIWGTVAVGIFSADVAVIPQLVGIAATGALCFPTSLAAMWLLHKTIGFRVSEHEEIGGLDLHEHGMEAYAGMTLAAETVAAK